MEEKTLEFIREKLKGRTNENGSPYAEHAERVADMMDTELERTVALLHDLPEDGDVTMQDLRDAGFSREVMECVGQLTRRNSLTYFDYIDDVGTNPVTAKVKLAEILDNQDVFRVKKLSFQTYSMEERSRKAVQLLLEMNPELEAWYSALASEKKTAAL